MDWSVVGVPDDLTLEDQQRKLSSVLSSANQVEQQPTWTADQQAEFSDLRVQAVALTLRNVEVPFELITSETQEPSEPVILIVGGKSASWISQIENEWHRHKFSSAQWSIQMVADLAMVPWDFTYFFQDRGIIGLWAAVAMLKHQRKQNLPQELWRLFQVCDPQDAKLYGSLSQYRDQVQKFKTELDSQNAIQGYIRAVQEAQKWYNQESERPSWQSQYFLKLSRCFYYRSIQPFVLPSVGLLDFSDDWFMTIDPLMQICTVFELYGLVVGTPLQDDSVQQALALSQALQWMTSEFISEDVWKQFRKVTETLRDRTSSDMILLILRKQLPN